MDRFIGEIFLFSGPFIPEGTLPCDGRVLPVQENQALYSIISNTYGGDGIRTFCLPDLRGRSAIGLCATTELKGRSIKELGNAGGEEYTTTAITLKEENLPGHTHTLSGEVKVSVAVASNDGVTQYGAGAYLASPPDPANPGLSYTHAYIPENATPPPTVGGNLAGVSAEPKLTINPTGDGVPVLVKVPRNPYLTLRYLMVVSGGDYPVRDDLAKDQ